jgi:hypothetical protein
VCVKQSYAKRNPEIYWQSMLSITPVTLPKLVLPNSSHLQSENHCFIPVQRPHIIAPLLPITRCFQSRAAQLPFPPNLSLRFTNRGLAPVAAAGFLSSWRSAGNGDWRPKPYVFGSAESGGIGWLITVAVSATFNGYSTRGQGNREILVFMGCFLIFFYS